MLFAAREPSGKVDEIQWATAYGSHPELSGSPSSSHLSEVAIAKHCMCCAKPRGSCVLC
jgi:hypothetical protein